MDLIIAGHREAFSILKSESMDVIFISGPNDKYRIEDSDKIESLAKDCCTLLFNDVTILKENMFPPKVEHIQETLSFSKGREKILITCQAGISRSSAIAYLVAAQKLGISAAFECLNPAIHIPNKLIITHGSIVLNEPDMVELMSRWKKCNEYNRKNQSFNGMV